MEAVLEQYWEALDKVCREAQKHEAANIARIGAMIAERIQEGKSLWSFGCTHSALLVGETVYRAGGLVLCNPIFAPGLWPGEIPVTRTSRLEKLSGYAKVLLEDLQIREGDVVIVFSTSGWNAVPVEFAQLVREQRKATVVAVTSTAYLELRPSPERKHLSEVSDYVIDNHIPVGDAAVALDKYPQIQMGPMSTYVGVALANGLMIAVAAALSEADIEPPVFRSGNVPGGMEQNLKTLAKYRGQIHSL
ncbi:MAG: sugar isomerase domain-containing protein [Limnochordia bacterium]